MKYAFPSLIGLKVKEAKVNIPDVAASGKVEIEVVFPENFLILGVPELSVDNVVLKVRIVGGGIGSGGVPNKLVVEVENTDTVNAVTGAVLTVKVAGIVGA
jgi:hypothetical protein